MIEKEDTLNYFLKTLTVITKLNALIEDRFFYNKLERKICDLTAFFIKLRSGDNNDVAQYIEHFGKTLSIVEAMLEDINDLNHLNVLKISPLFLEVQKYLLLFKIGLVRDRKSLAGNKKSPNIFKNEPLNKIESMPTVKFTRKTGRLTDNKKRILDFIKSYPNIRTKDIIQEFNVISDRTVKRNLNDLIQSGLIKKRVDNKAVYYYISE